MGRIIFGLAVLTLGVLAANVGNASDSFRLLKISGQHVKWGTPSFGAGTTVTYAVMYGDVERSGNRNCVPTVGIESLLETSALSAAAFEAELAAAFALWSRVADIRFEMVSDPERADVLIGSQSLPRGRSYADITLSEADRDGVHSIESGIVCLNPQLRWVEGLTQEPGSDNVLLRYALAHEIGHLLALDHPSARGSLMSFLYDESVAELQPGDIAGAIAIYGPAREEDEGLHVAGSEPRRREAENLPLVADDAARPIPAAYSPAP